jgi:hypothetical protein
VEVVADGGLLLLLLLLLHLLPQLHHTTGTSFGCRYRLRLFSRITTRAHTLTHSTLTCLLALLAASAATLSCRSAGSATRHRVIQRPMNFMRTRFIRIFSRVAPVKLLSSARRSNTLRAFAGAVEGAGSLLLGRGATEHATGCFITGSCVSCVGVSP